MSKYKVNKDSKRRGKQNCISVSENCKIKETIQNSSYKIIKITGS